MSGKPDNAMMMELMERVWPLHRTLVHDDMDKTLDIIAEYLPAGHDWKVHRYPSGQKIWTWTVPEKFAVDEARLELLTPNGPEKVVDFRDHILHILSYSLPFEGEMGWDELAPHLFTNPGRPQAIPWAFKYYDRDWGFSLPHEQWEKLPRDGRYRVTIRTRFEPGFLSVGEFSIPGTSDEWLLFVCATCHPWQVNDSISGVVATVDFVRREAERLKAGGARGHFGIKVLFLPETIGSLAFLANNEPLIDKCRFAFFSEFLGNEDRFRLQRSLQGDTMVDRATAYVLKRMTGGDFIDGPFCHTIITNDEKVTNAAGVNIPTVALNRWPDGGWPFYHTTDDRPAAMNQDKIAEASVLYEQVTEILQTNVYPRRRFRGPLFLSGLKLDFDWQRDRRTKRGMQHLILRLEGNISALDIALQVDLDYADVVAVLEAMRNAGLVDLAHVPWPSA